MKITQFANPELLWLLVLLLPMAALYVWRVRRGGSALRISSVVPLEGVSRGVRYWARHLPFVLRCTAVALLVVALARPQNSEKGKLHDHRRYRYRAGDGRIDQHAGPRL